MIEIKIKGEERNAKTGEMEAVWHPAGFKFNKYAFRQFVFIVGVTDLDTLGAVMIYCAYKGWCFAKQIEEKLTFENINDWIDSETDEPVVKELIDEFHASDMWKRVEDGMKSELKKNEPLPIPENQENHAA